MEPTSTGRQFTNVATFVTAVNACSRTYADRQGDEEAYREAILVLFQAAKKQNLAIPKKHIWGEGGIGALLVTLSTQTAIVASLRKILYELITTELTSCIIEDLPDPNTQPPAYRPLLMDRPATSNPPHKTTPKKTSPKRTSPQSPPPPKGDPRNEIRLSAPVTTISNEMCQALHTYILEKPDRSQIVLNYDIAPRKEKYEKAYQFCESYLCAITRLPENIQTTKQEIAVKLKNLLPQNAIYFKNAEQNGYLHTRIQILLTYLQEQFPLVSE